MASTIYRATLLGFKEKPLFNAEGELLNEQSLVHFKDGALEVTAQGRIGTVESWLSFEQRHRLSITEHPETVDSFQIIDLRGLIVTPGFIDAHLHFPQMQAMGAHGAELLQWLDRYIFPAETAYQNPDFARKMAPIFWKELWRHGTVMSAVYSSSHTEATAILLQSASQLGAWAIVGKTLMDQNAPQSLLESTDQILSDSRALLSEWSTHKDNINYAITPRFAISCSERLMRGLAKLWDEVPTAYMQTHISENQSEVQWVRKLFPNFRNYLDVYQNCGLVRRGSLLAHGIWLEDSEWASLADTRSVVVHCPLSNEFLGSGLFNRKKSMSYNVSLALGSDVGAGTSLCMLKTAEASCRVARQQGIFIHPLTALFEITLGNAQALRVDDRIGALKTGMEAHLLVMDLNAVPVARHRLAERHLEELNADELASMMVYLGDERMIQDVFISGVSAFPKIQQQQLRP